jgi:hypothetical protein
MYVLPGDPALVDETSIDLATWADATTIDGAGSNNVALALGDVDGDMLVDAVVGAPQAGIGGEVYVFLGGSLPGGGDRMPALALAGASPSPASRGSLAAPVWQGGGPLFPPDYTLLGAVPDGDYGRSVAAGDVDGDAIAEVAVGGDGRLGLGSIINAAPDREIVNLNHVLEVDASRFGVGGELAFARRNPNDALVDIFFSRSVSDDEIEVCAAPLASELGALYSPIDPTVADAVGAGWLFTVSGPTDPMTFQPAGPGGVLALVVPAAGACTSVPVVDGVATLGDPDQYAPLSLADAWTHDDAHSLHAFTTIRR